MDERKDRKMAKGKSKSAKKRAKKKVKLAGMISKKGKAQTRIVFREGNLVQETTEIEVAKQLSLKNDKGKSDIIEGKASEDFDEEEWIAVKNKNKLFRGEASTNWAAKEQQVKPPLFQELEQMEKYSGKAYLHLEGAAETNGMHPLDEVCPSKDMANDNTQPRIEWTPRGKRSDSRKKQNTRLLRSQ